MLRAGSGTARPGWKARLAESGPRQDMLDRRARFRHRGIEFGERLRRVAVLDRGLELARTIGHAKGADRTSRPLQRMRERARFGRHGGKRADESAGLL